MMVRPMEQAITFDELHWLFELSAKTQKNAVPKPISDSLLQRKLIEPKSSGFVLTVRGRIALAKLG